MHLLACLVLAVSPPIASGVTPGLDALTAFRGLAGTWRGTLDYRDYQSGEWTALPARMVAEAAETGPYLVQRLEFDDPGRTVIGEEVIALDPESQRMATVAFTSGVIRSQVFDVTRVAVVSPREWTVVLETDGLDNELPARIRLTETRAGTKLTATNEVRYLEAKDRAAATENDGWFVRNRLTLERASADPGTLVGTWRVDLRPTPESPAYLKSLRITSVTDGVVQGSFYEDSPIRNGVVNAAWDAVHVAFTTEDGNGIYSTTAVLRGDRLEGMTHALGRGFLGVWTAVRVE